MAKYLTPFLVLFASPALAAEGAGGQFLGPGLKALGALVLVLGLILLLYALSRKGFGFMPNAKGGDIEVLEMRSLGPKKGLCLVRVKGREVLLGLGTDRVEFLCSIGDKDVEEEDAASFEEALRSSQDETP